MHKATGFVAITLSVLALFLSIWTFNQADARAEQALQRREKLLVERYKPEVERICREFGLNQPRDPQTLDELFKPLGGLFTRLSK